MSTVEVEDVIELAKAFDKMVVGVIDEVLPHPNADKLKICRTRIGADDMRNIVCGGINLYDGMMVAVACPGAMVRWHGEGEPVEIKLVKIRGEQSYGMICTSAEIGLSDLFPATEDAQILDLSDFAVEVGTPLAKALELDDVILEIDNKSLTNRPDLWGHYGIAREISALYNLPFNEIKPFDFGSDEEIEIVVEDSSRCRRYIGVKIEGLSVIPSPYAMQSRIWSVGMRPINALVDITNYVMLDTGQPTHAFDSDNISGHITVRRAIENETLLLLNNAELTLTTDDLVIADNEEAVGLAGVMGGAKDSVLPTTNKVILEIANFDAISIRRTAARYKTRTEAVSRYEKAIDPERCDMALSLAMWLFAEIYPKMNIIGHRDIYPTPLERNEIEVSLDWLKRRLGMEIPREDIALKLGLLGFDTKHDNGVLHIVVPSWRSTGDVSIPNDVMEEIARMYGFENFELAPITTSFECAINQIKTDVDRRIREYLAFRCGMREVLTYPWMTDEFVNAVLQDASDIVSLSTPPSPDERYVRSSLLPNLCKAVVGNLRYFNEFSIFETAQVIRDCDYKARYDARELLPLERKNLAGAFVGKPNDMVMLFRKAKGVLEVLPRHVHITPITLEKIDKPIWADDFVWLNIVHEGIKIGNLASLSRKVSLDCGIKNSSVILFELDIDSIEPYPSRTNSFVHLPEYPMTDYDISMLFDSSAKWSDIRRVALGNGGNASDLLRDVLFIDEYKGRQVADGKKSITIRLIIGSLNKTLTSEDIEGEAKKVVKRLNKAYNAEIR